MSASKTPFPYGETITDKIADIFCSEQLYSVKELGVVLEDAPNPTDHNTNNFIHWVDGNVGISSWAVPALCYTSSKRLWKDRSDIRAATALLIADPGYNTAWNTRKKIFNVSNLSKELYFSTIVLTYKPKCAEAWSHRAWVIRVSGVDKISYRTELNLARVASSRYKSNYYAGVHRLRFVGLLSNEQRAEELELHCQWLQTHIYDSSAWWYYRVLLQVTFKDQAIPQEETNWLGDINSHYDTPPQSIRSIAQWISSNQNSSPQQSPLD